MKNVEVDKFLKATEIALSGEQKLKIYYIVWCVILKLRMISRADPSVEFYDLVYHHQHHREQQQQLFPARIYYFRNLRSPSRNFHFTCRCRYRKLFDQQL